MGIFDFFKKKATPTTVIKEDVAVQVSTNAGIVTKKSVEVEPKEETVVIHSSIAGITFEGRQEVLNRVIEEYIYEEIEDGVEPYDGLTNSEFIDLQDEIEKLYEYEDEKLSYVKIIAEPENEYDSHAQAVHVSSNGKDWFQVGYLPQKDINRTKNLFSKGKLVNVEGKIVGGNYKYIKEDKNGLDRVYKAKENYYLLLILYFNK